MRDSEGNGLEIGDEVIFVYNLWRGRDIACRARVLSLAEQSASVEVISGKYKGETKRSKYTKMLRTVRKYS